MFFAIFANIKTVCTMTTLIVNIDAGGDARKIAEALSLMKGVANVRVEEPSVSKWEQAIAEGAVGVDIFFDELNARIEKWSDNA
jgi:hypothetical protein